MSIINDSNKTTKAHRILPQILDIPDHVALSRGACIKLFFVFLAGACVLVPSVHCSQNFNVAASNIELSPFAAPSQTFPLGERLMYNISWIGVPIGTGELWVKEKITLKGREVFHVVGVLKTNDFLSKVYPVNDEIHSWIDSRSLQSVQFEKSTSEGGKRAHEITVFEKPAHDVLSVFYWVRRQSLAAGSSTNVAVIVDNKPWTLEAVVLRRQTLQRHKLGSVDTILVEPIGRTEGIEKRRTTLFNLTADALRKPVRIAYKAPFGRIVGVLICDPLPAS